MELPSVLTHMLSSPEVREAAICLSAFLVPYAIGRNVFTEPKKRAWVLSTVSSLGCSLGSVPYAYKAIASGFDTSTFAYQDDPFSRRLVAFFLTFLVSIPSFHTRRC